MSDNGNSSAHAPEPAIAPAAVSAPAAGNPRIDKILDHTYDDIQEYDNPMPRWWLMTFAGTIIYSVLYLFNIGPIGNGDGRIADYERDMREFAAAHPAAGGGDVSGDALLALVKNPEVLHEGQEAYAAYCASCHRPDGGGLIGPNLTDAYWIHGGRIEQVYATVANGVQAKGMPAWAKLLKPEDLRAVVAYVASLQGSNPADAKAPQGDLVTP